jgi:hypothetical protein
MRAFHYPGGRSLVLALFLVLAAAGAAQGHPLDAAATAFRSTRALSRAAIDPSKIVQRRDVDD